MCPLIRIHISYEGTCARLQKSFHLTKNNLIMSQASMSHTVLSLAGPVMALKAASRPEDDDEADLLLPWSFPPITFLVTLRPTAERRREQVDKEIIQKYSASSSCVQTAKCSHTNIIALVTSKPVTNICNDTDSSTYVTVCPAYFAVSVTVTARAMFKFLGASSFAFFLQIGRASCRERVYHDV